MASESPHSSFVVSLTLSQIPDNASLSSSEPSSSTRSRCVPDVLQVIAKGQKFEAFRGKVFEHLPLVLDVVVGHGLGIPC